MHTRDELERAFARYQEVAATSASSHDWRAWADLFTEDATYIEHLYGEMHGREAIYSWIQSTMTQPVAEEMTQFPIGWSVIDEERGWIVCQVWNRMDDPGDGSVHQAYNVTILHYAGDGLWSYEEDIYNPAHFQTMIAGYLQTKQRLAGA